MASKLIVAAFSVIAATAPVSAANQDLDQATGAPAGGESTRYCMRVEANTGSRIETVKCWTRAEWAEQGVDVDKDWAKEGVEVIA